MKSCDLRALLEAHWGLLSVKEHRKETLIDDVEVATSNAMTKSETSYCPLSVKEHRGETLIYIF